MRWPQENAISRRDRHITRTRRLSLWIAGGATAASVGLAAALGAALPGHAATSAPARPAGHHDRIAPPVQAPGPATGAPVVSSGGS